VAAQAALRVPQVPVLWQEQRPPVPAPLLLQVPVLPLLLGL